MSDNHSGAARPHKLTPEQISAALERWLPTRLDGAAVAVSDLIAPKGTGFSNQTMLFSARWSGVAHELVLQAAPVGQGLFARYDFAGMARAQQRVAQTSTVPVANVRWHEADTAVLGVPFYVMDRVAGRAPTDKPPYHRTGWFAELPAAAQTRAWWSGIEAMAQLHALDVRRDDFLFMQDTPWGMPVDADPAQTRLRQWRQFLAWADAEPLPVVSAALDELERTRPAVQPLRVHWGDAKLSNCMVDHTGVRALLDWELCGLSAPEEDLTHWLMLDWSLWAVNDVPRLASLPSPAQTVARYEELSGRQTHATLWWWRFGLVRLAIIYHRIMGLLRQRGHVAPGKTLAEVNPIVRFIAPVFEKDVLP
jgi:aminoglycoside phosphotransferase (APT) family kinase protein